MTPNEFVQWIAPSAIAQCKPYDLPPSVVIAQAALESGWGHYKIGEYNLFGRKAVTGDRSITVPTQEYYDGEWVMIDAAFKDYNNLLQAIDDWCILITQEPCYAPAWAAWYNTHDVEQFVRALGPVYATDPDYADKVIATIRANGLSDYDQGVV